MAMLGIELEPLGSAVNRLTGFYYAWSHTPRGDCHVQGREME